MVDVDSYIKKLTPKAQRSILKPFEEAIMKLRENGASLQQVVEFLAENGTTTTIGNVSKFIKKVTEKAAESPAKPKAEKQNPPAAGRDNGSDEKKGGNAAEASNANEDQVDGNVGNEGIEGIESELVRPPGITNAEWNKMKSKHKNRTNAA